MKQFFLFFLIIPSIFFIIASLYRFPRTDASSIEFYNSPYKKPTYHFFELDQKIQMQSSSIEEMTFYIQKNQEDGQESKNIRIEATSDGATLFSTIVTPDQITGDQFTVTLNKKIPSQTMDIKITAENQEEAVGPEMLQPLTTVIMTMPYHAVFDNSPETSGRSNLMMTMQYDISLLEAIGWEQTRREHRSGIIFSPIIFWTWAYALIVLIGYGAWQILFAIFQTARQYQKNR
jgi:hypothetical protein